MKDKTTLPMKARRALESLCINECQVGLEGFVETSNSDAYLCHSCEAELCKLVQLSSAISARLLCLQPAAMQPG